MAKDHKISKDSAQRAKDKARADKQRVLGHPKKNLSTKDKMDIATYNAIIEAADTIINEEE